MGTRVPRRQVKAEELGIWKLDRVGGMGKWGQRKGMKGRMEEIRLEVESKDVRFIHQHGNHDQSPLPHHNRMDGRRSAASIMMHASASYAFNTYLTGFAQRCD